jgi:hypothetical protein
MEWMGRFKINGKGRRSKYSLCKLRGKSKCKVKATKEYH